MSRRPTLKEALWTMLNSAPRTPAMTEIMTMKGSCSNHSLLESSATPLNDSTPYFHLQCQVDSAMIKRVPSSHQHSHLIKSRPTMQTVHVYHKHFEVSPGMQLGKGEHSCGGADEAAPSHLARPVRRRLLQAKQDAPYGCSKGSLHAPDSMTWQGVLGCMQRGATRATPSPLPHTLLRTMKALSREKDSDSDGGDTR